MKKKEQFKYNEMMMMMVDESELGLICRLRCHRNGTLRCRRAVDDDS